MQGAITAVFMLIGALFMLIGGLGVVRFPDLYTRVSASTKASTLGVSFSLFGLAVHFHELGITMRALATIVFVVITAPVAAHLISRAAYAVGVRLWDQAVTDELHGQYEGDTGELKSRPYVGEEGPVDETP
jgi:multicomponent Na+:H+ antiporter subunit G